MLYLPASNDIKFKAKAWIDVVALGRPRRLVQLLMMPSRAMLSLRTPTEYGNVPTFVVSLALFGVALHMGRRYDAIKASGAIVGEEDAAPTGG